MILTLRNLSPRALPFMIEGHSLWEVDERGRSAADACNVIWLPVRSERRVLFVPQQGSWQLGALSRPEGTLGLKATLQVTAPR